VGVPNHYSHDIAVRCHSLIRHLMPVVSDGLPDDERFGGPLRTTFLLAMAAPMIVLPIERMFKPGGVRGTQVGDDRDLDPTLAGEVRSVLGDDRPFVEAPFAAAAEWRYVAGYPPFNIADRWPDRLLDELAMPQAVETARMAPAKRILLDLRNALAHGGIAYLGQNGRNADGPATMFAFVATERRKVNILRIEEGAFTAFLGAWADWLGRQAAVVHALNAQGAIAA